MQTEIAEWKISNIRTAVVRIQCLQLDETVMQICSLGVIAIYSFKLSTRLFSKAGDIY